MLLSLATEAGGPLPLRYSGFAGSEAEAYGAWRWGKRR